MTDRTFFVVFILCLSTFVVKAQLNVCPIQGTEISDLTRGYFHAVFP